MTPNDQPDKGRGRRPRKYRHLTPTQRRWRTIRRVLKWVTRVGVVGTVAGTAAFAWSFTPPPNSASVSKYVRVQTVSQLPDHRFTTLTPASSNAYIELIVEQPQDSYFASDAWESSPYGSYGRAACLFVAKNVFGHQLIAFGVVSDFIVARNGLKVWAPNQPLVATSTGWHIDALQGQRLDSDAQAHSISVSASTDLTLFNQVGAPLRDYSFVVRLAIGSNGMFQCSVNTTSVSTGWPLA